MTLVYRHIGTGSSFTRIMALGAYITYKILDFPDLTVDGSFPLGAAVTAALHQPGRESVPYLAYCSALAGALAGMCTGLIHVKVQGARSVCPASS